MTVQYLDKMGSDRRHMILKKVISLGQQQRGKRKARQKDLIGRAAKETGQQATSK